MLEDTKFDYRQLRIYLIQVLQVNGAATLFISGLLMNIVQAFLYVTLRPVSRKCFRKINKYICASMYAQVMFLPEWLANTEVHIYVDPEEYKKYYGKEHSFCIINHTYEIDWMINWILCDKMGCLGNFKACSKKDAKWLPVFGWSWIFSDFAFLERSYKKDETVLKTKISAMVEHPDPIWLTFYPEGTRLTPEKHTISKQFSLSNNLPIYKHHMLPRTKGFKACLPLMRDKGGLYDICLAFEGVSSKGGHACKPTYQDISAGDWVAAHVYLKRVDFREVPIGEEEEIGFLYELYKKKDKLLDSFYQTGDFFAKSGIERLPAQKLQKGYTSLLNFLFWNSLLTYPLLQYWISLIYSGQYILFSIIFLLLLLTFWATIKCKEYISIKSASNYGMDVRKETDH